MDAVVIAVVPGRTQAERLIDLANNVLYPKGHLLRMGEPLDHERFALVATALKFKALPKHVQFTAMVEGWSQERIVRECY